ncbi:MAG: transcriptional regulator GutM, partial [Enterococcus faecalis]|nr:transcriptional regulator GutM [Enterococcus faecalis]
AGKLKAGTIILFAVDSQGKILAARKMQGVTVLAKFHPLPQYVNEDIHYMDHYHPLVQKENKLTQQAMENAREIYLRVELGNYQETQPLTPLNGAKIQWQLWKNKVQTKLKGSVE